VTNRIRVALAVVAAALLAGCSFQNRNEREADRITRAVIANDLRPVENDVAKGIEITRVRVAQWSDELNAQGTLISVKETTANCTAGWHCFDVKFEKHEYVERMRFDENGKVVNWDFHMVQQ
jgi:outer membrane lipopolysaccharide assembly protein LptE/RlpB